MVLQDSRSSDPDRKGNLHFIFSEALVLNSPTWKVYFPWSSFLTSLTDSVCLPRRDDITYLLLGESSLSSKNQLPSASSRDTRHSNSPEYVSGTSVLSNCFRISSGAPVDHIIQTRGFCPFTTCKITKCIREQDQTILPSQEQFPCNLLMYINDNVQAYTALKK